MLFHGFSRNWVIVNPERENNISQREFYKNNKTRSLEDGKDKCIFTLKSNPEFISVTLKHLLQFRKTLYILDICLFIPLIPILTGS